MTQQDQSDFFKKFTAQMSSVIISKSHDYSQTNVDVLSNFKLAGTICGLTPELNCLSLIATKVARLGVLLSKTDAPRNESIADSILDLSNYSILLAMILSEKETK